MVNLKANIPAAVVAKTTATFAFAGINSTNTHIIYEVGDPLKSYVPGRLINGITGFEAGKGYYFIAKTDLDLTGYLVPKNQLDRIYKWATGPIVIGDSISTEGYGTSWHTQAASILGVSGVVNLAVSGQGVRPQLTSLYNTLPEVAVKPLASFAGFNDCRVMTGEQIRYNHVQAAHRAAGAAQFAKSVEFPVDANANVAFSGSVPATVSDATLQALGARAWYFRNGGDATADIWDKTVATNETVTFAVLNGTAIAIGTFATDGSTYNFSRIKVTVDGVDRVTYDPNGKSYSAAGGLIQDAIVVTGLTAGNHSVVLTFLDGGKRSIVDWVGPLKTPAELLDQTFTILDLPHMTSNVPDWGYLYPGGETTQAILDGCSAQRKANMLATFTGYPMAFIDINAVGYYEPETHSDQVNSDQIHPNTNGSGKIANRVVDYMVTEF